MTMPDAPIRTGGPDRSETIIPLYAEELAVTKRETVLGKVFVRLQTQTHEQVIDEMLSQEHVDVQRVAVGRTVESVPSVREEGDTTIIPVVEEVLVIERRLVLKEEIRLTRVRTRGRHRESVMLRSQQATVERTEAKQPELLEEQTP